MTRTVVVTGGAKGIGRATTAAFAALGDRVFALGRDEEALAAFSRAADIMARAFGADHPRSAIVYENQGEVLAALHRDAEALAAFERSVAISRTTGSNALLTSYGLTGAGLALLALGRPAAATAPLEEALRLRADKPVEAGIVAETRFGLARALWSRPEARARALALAREARDGWTKSAAAGSAASRARKTAMIAEVDGWLAAHRR